jgi:cytosine/adenosine deaminase-related metal-dependent hydrolase
MIQSLLIANRSEIACRIIRTARTAAFVAALAATAPVVAQTCTIALSNANVWNGTAFEKRSIGIKDGKFTAATEGLTPFEASSLYVTPPYADAHNHRIDAPIPGDTTHARALAQGIFYALNPNNVRPDGPTRTGQSGLVDLQASGGGLTRPGGHPQPLYEGLAARGILGSTKAADLPGKAFHLVTTPAEARAAVAKVRANGASMVKLYLVNHAAADGGDGLSAENFEAAVTEAKKLGLYPIVHVETAADFRRAVAAKVHALVHMPYMIEKGQDAADLRITPKDAALAAANNVYVVPTVTLTHIMNDGAKLAAMQDILRANLTLLRDAKVKIGLGADQWTMTLHHEIAFVRALAIFEGPDMIEMATTNGAQIAFPRRKIGMIAPGYDASFLAWFRPLNRAWSEAHEPVVGMREGKVLIDSFGLFAKVCPKVEGKP